MDWSKWISRSGLVLACAVASAAFATATPAMGKSHKNGGYVQTNLVSDGAIPANVTDPNLVNAWGIAFFPGGPFWINDNGKGMSTLYLGDGTPFSLLPSVTIPPPNGSPAGTTSAPTGIVFNSSLGFNLPSSSTPALFIFDTEDGTISAWNLSSGTSAQLMVDNSSSGAVYKGLAMGENLSGVFLYATNFHAGTVDVFDSSFHSATLSGSFTDPNLPAGYAPFGIANVHGDLIVTFALQNAEKHDDVAGPGHGFVDVFDTDGNLIRRFATKGKLNSPWGITAASLNFGKFSGDILIGNFGDGALNAFDPVSATPRGQLRGKDGKPIMIDGLWSITFGGGAKSSPDTLYFTAGPNGESDGLFGTLTPPQ